CRRPQSLTSGMAGPAASAITVPKPLGNEPGAQRVVATRPASTVPSDPVQQSSTVVQGISTPPGGGSHVPVRPACRLQTSATPWKRAAGTASAGPLAVVSTRLPANWLSAT